MIKFLFTLPLIAMSVLSLGQNDPVLTPIHNMFDGMRAGDSAMIALAFAPDATLETYMTGDQGMTIHSSTAVDFIAAAGKPHDKVWNEVIWSYDVRKDGPMATVWTEYTFYHGESMSHCGVNTFTLADYGDNWKITRVADTRRKSECKELPEDEHPEYAWKKEINEQVWRPFQKAYTEFDAELMNSVHRDDVIRASSWAIRIGEEYKNRNLENYKKSKERGDQRKIDFFFESRKATETHAVETGYYRVTANRGGQERIFYGFFHVILKKENDQWQILSDWDTDELNGTKINADWISHLEKFE